MPIFIWFRFEKQIEKVGQSTEMGTTLCCEELQVTAEGVIDEVLKFSVVHISSAEQYGKIIC